MRTSSTPRSKAGGDGVGVDALRQGQRAREGAEGALHAVEALLAVLVLGLALAGDRERAVLDLDLEVLLGHAGEVGAQDEVLGRLDEIHGRDPAADATVAWRPAAGRRRC